MKFAYDIIKKPVITERSMMGAQDNKYTFEVAVDAGKIEIKKAVEEIFGVKVAKVNTIKLPGKWKRMGVHVGKRPDIKKAVVTLTADSKKIEILENMMSKTTSAAKASLSVPAKRVFNRICLQIHKNREHVSRFLYKSEEKFRWSELFEALVLSAPCAVKPLSFENVFSNEVIVWGSHPDNNESRS